jgi:hypothetical protein
MEVTGLLCTCILEDPGSTTSARERAGSSPTLKDSDTMSTSVMGTTGRIIPVVLYLLRIRESDLLQLRIERAR